MGNWFYADLYLLINRKRTMWGLTLTAAMCPSLHVKQYARYINHRSVYFLRLDEQNFGNIRGRCQNLPTYTERDDNFCWYFLNESDCVLGEWGYYYYYYYYYFLNKCSLWTWNNFNLICWQKLILNLIHLSERWYIVYVGEIMPELFSV
jgi:hypothetical protein